MTKKQVLITDRHELQNVLDDYSTDRPYLNVYDSNGGVFTDEDELQAWRAKGQIITRAQAIAADEPTPELPCPPGVTAKNWTLPFTHWSKDPLVPYNGCGCSSCEDARASENRGAKHD